MILLLALAVAEPPAFVTEIIERDHELPRYAEQYYHPLGRSPVVDALLADPMYSIRFSKEASQRLRAAAETQELAEVVEILEVLDRPNPAGEAFALEPQNAGVYVSSHI